MYTFNDLPNELLLQIFPHFPLKSLIAALGVRSLWRHLAPLAEINPARRGLLELYLQIIASPIFRQTRPWLLERLRPFDREAYIDSLLEQHNYLPEDFRIWILEWPAKAVIAGCWPGLPTTYYGLDSENKLMPRRDRLFRGCNWLGRQPPVLHAVEFSYIQNPKEANPQDVPALLVWEEYLMTWLVLGPKSLCSHGVYTVGDDEYYGDFEDRSGQDGLDEDTEPWFKPDGDYMDAEEGITIYSSWTYWLLKRFHHLESMERGYDRMMGYPEPSESRPWGDQDEGFHSQPRADRVWKPKS
ncbi:hypothetical protein R3P38DRAFT_2889872 [Favolaschia claudopus]|uniref:F-box domain-containing protein n=1 Tax=Favolaschia claudopus TaxID=2862362 RepID=A0AAW0CTP2_9AGAR